MDTIKIAYIQPIGGASGDMLLGALVDAGLPPESLRRELAKLPVTGYAIEAAAETRAEMRGTHLQIRLTNRARHSPAQLLQALTDSDLAPPVKDQAAQTLRALWQAEARVHGQPPDALELEELGSIDTLLDVAGVCYGLHQLGIAEVYAAPLVLGEPAPPRRPGGYSNPAPATLELIAAAAAPVAADTPAPTGAALITTLAQFHRPAFSLQRVGIGLGAKNPPGFPNALRLWLGEIQRPDPTPPSAAMETLFRPADVTLLETNLDDATGLTLGHAQESLFALGALDVWLTPVQMKKNRPGAVLSALVPRQLEQAAVALILRETPTLGVRARPADRYVAHRQSITIETGFGPASVKIKSLPSPDGPPTPVSAAPEPDDCRRIAAATGIPFQEIYHRAAEAARQQLL